MVPGSVETTLEARERKEVGKVGLGGLRELYGGEGVCVGVTERGLTPPLTSPPPFMTDELSWNDFVR